MNIIVIAHSEKNRHSPSSVDSGTLIVVILYYEPCRYIMYTQAAGTCKKKLFRLHAGVVDHMMIGGHRRTTFRLPIHCLVPTRHYYYYYNIT